MSTKKQSPVAKRTRSKKSSECSSSDAERPAALGRLSKSASELSTRDPPAQPARARSAAHHHAQLSVVHRTHNFFSTLKSRWTRSRSRERAPGGTALSIAASADSGGEADRSSEQSTPACSPRRIARPSHDSPLAKQRDLESLPSTSGTPAPAVRSQELLANSDEGQRLREQLLRQYSFFQLRIHLKRGQNLVAMDKNGTSDPYVKFKAGGRLLHKSRIVYRDLNPVWDETFTVPVEDPFQPVHIKVFDYDWGLQDDFMGSCQLDLTALELGRPQDLVLCLHDPGKPGQFEMGEIVLGVTLWPKSQEDKEQVPVHFISHP